jgi:DNA-binding transcriptional LysR family regulator
MYRLIVHAATTRRLRVAFDVLPLAHWGPLFHVLCMEHPNLRVEWQPSGFPVIGRSLLEGADVGLFVSPPLEDGLDVLVLESNPMALVMAAGHRLARGDELRVADVLDEPFPGGADLKPEWVAFWTLDAQRGGPPRLSDDRVENAEQGLAVVAAGRAVATASLPIANGLAHPGVVALPLVDGPPVDTCLVWPSGTDDPGIHSLVGLARDMTRELEEPRGGRHDR